MNEIIKTIKESKQLFTGFVILAIVFLIIACIRVVPDDKVCFKKRLGKFSETTLTSGLNFFNVITTEVICVDAKIQKYNSKTETYTKDMQTARVNFFVNWSIIRENATQLYKLMGNRYKDSLASESESAIKSIIGQVDSSYLVSSRNEVEQKITELLNTRLHQLNLKADSVRLEDISYSESYEKSIEEKQIAQQKALTEKIKQK